VAIEEDTFLIRLADAKVTFERDGSGAVTTLVLDQGGNKTRGTKK
jgi:hypothetical protein